MISNKRDFASARSAGRRIRTGPAGRDPEGPFRCAAAAGAHSGWRGLGRGPAGMLPRPPACLPSVKLLDWPGLTPNSEQAGTRMGRLKLATFAREIGLCADPWPRAMRVPPRVGARPSQLLMCGPKQGDWGLDLRIARSPSRIGADGVRGGSEPRSWPGRRIGRHPRRPAEPRCLSASSLPSAPSPPGERRSQAKSAKSLPGAAEPRCLSWGVCWTPRAVARSPCYSITYSTPAMLWQGVLWTPCCGKEAKSAVCVGGKAAEPSNLFGHGPDWAAFPAGAVPLPGSPSGTEPGSRCADAGSTEWRPCSPVGTDGGIRL